MDKKQMTEVAAKMNKAEARKKEALSKAIEHVKAGELTRDEAAKCVAGAMKKAADEFGLPGAADHRYARLLIDQALEGEDFQGLSIENHL